MKIHFSLVTLVAASLMLASLATIASDGDTPSKGETVSKQFWWPEQLNLVPIRAHDVASNPYGAFFDYAAAF